MMMVQSPEEYRKNIRIYPVTEDELKEIYYNPLGWTRVIVYVCCGLLFAEGLNDFGDPRLRTVQGIQWFFIAIPTILGLLGLIATIWHDAKIIGKKRDAIKRRIHS